MAKIDSFIFSPSRYSQDEAILALSNEFGMAGKYLILELSGIVMAQKDWWKLEALIPIPAIMQTLSVTREECDSILEALEEYKPGVVRRESNRKIKFRYPGLYRFLGRYAQAQCCIENGYLEVGTQTPLDYDEFLNQFNGIQNDLKNFKNPPRGRNFKNPPPPYLDPDQGGKGECEGERVIQLLERIVRPSRPIPAKTRAGWIEKAEKVAQAANLDALEAQFNAIAAENWFWSQKITTIPQFYKQFVENGVDFVRELQNDRRKQKRTVSSPEELKNGTRL